jgi:hypothetical protein
MVEFLQMATLKVEIDFNRDGDFDHPLSDITEYVRDDLYFSSGWFNVGQLESNVSSHVAPKNSLRLYLDNQERVFSYERLDSELYQGLYAGLMVRVTVSLDEISYSWTYFSKSISEAPGEFGTLVVTLDCLCAMPRVQLANYEPEITTDISTDAALIDMMESATLIVPYTSDYFVIDGSTIDGAALIFDPDTDVSPMIDFESGLTTMDYIGDVLYRDRKGISVQKAQLFISDMCMAEAYGRFFYQPRDVKFHFHNRYHDKVTASSLTLTAHDYVAAPTRTTPVYNKIRLHYQPRELGASNSVLFTSKSVPIQLQPDQEREIRVRFVDPDDVQVPVVSLNITEPVVSTDIVVTNSEDVDVTSSVYKSADLKGTGGTIFFRNDATELVTIDTIQVRGTPIKLPLQEIAEATSGTSIVKHNALPLPDLKGAYITDAEFAQNVVNFLIERHSIMRRVIESVSIIVTDDNFVDVMSVTIGDVICIQDEWTGHDVEYVVLGETHTYDISRDIWRAQWSVRSNDSTPYFIIDSSEIDGPHIIGY